MTEASEGPARILIAGIGNIFLGDDAFGVEVVRRLALRALPSGVRVIDFGIRGIDLAFALLDQYDAVILVDALPRGGIPGTLYVLEPDVQESTQPLDSSVEMHHLDPVTVLRLAASLGAPPQRIFVVGCEPSLPVDPDDMQTELSQAVSDSIDEAVAVTERLALKVLEGDLSLLEFRL